MSDGGALDDRRFRVLHAVRIKGLATPADVAAITGLEDAEAILDELRADGLTEARAARDAAYFTQTPAGQAAHHDELGRRLTGPDRDRIAAVYDERFLALNVRFKRLCAAWQEQERFELIEEAVEVHDEMTAVLAAMAGYDDRFDRYRERFDQAIEAFQDGDGSALVAPVGSSYHNVWFELHEDLIVTLGRSRADEES